MSASFRVKCGLISEDIFNLVLVSKKCAKSLKNQSKVILQIFWRMRPNSMFILKVGNSSGKTRKLFKKDARFKKDFETIKYLSIIQKEIT